MTDKQKRILEAASELFSLEGYHATSTSKIAKEAQVSEGLIFRHFINKEGLLNAILIQGDQLLNMLITPIINEEDAKQLIKKTLEMPFNISENEFDLWKLRYKLKWELNREMPDTMKSLEKALEKAFTKLRYKKPRLEADFLIKCIEGISASILNGTLLNQIEFKEFLIQKYYL